MSSKRKFTEKEEAVLMDKSKKQCKKTTSVELSMLEKLLMEILEKICSYISCSEIRQMLLTSKTINSKIANSSYIMDRFKIKFEHITELSRDNFPSLSQRKYSSIIIPFVRQKALCAALSHLNKYGNYVKEIKFEGNYSTKMLSRILQVCKNVRKIEGSDGFYFRGKSTDKVNRIDGILSLTNLGSFNTEKHEASNVSLAIEKELAADPSPLNLPRLKTLSCFTLGPTFNLFGDCQVKQITILDIKNCLEARRLERFLSKQKALEIMRIPPTLACTSYFPSRVNFKLKSLDIRDLWSESYTNFLITINFQKFVDKLKESLEQLHAPLSLLHHFSEFKLLKTVDLNVYSSANANSTVMPQVENLSITMPYDYGHRTSFKMFEIFPNLKELQISDLKSSFVYQNFGKIGDLINIANLTFKSSTDLNLLFFNFFDLESLQLIGCTLSQSDDLSISQLPKTKNLIIDNSSIPARTKIYDQTRLQKVTFKNCSQLSWILNVIHGNDDFVIDHLMLESLKLPRSILQAIISNPHKIQLLSLERVEISENA